MEVLGGKRKIGASRNGSTVNGGSSKIRGSNGHLIPAGEELSGAQSSPGVRTGRAPQTVVISVSVPIEDFEWIQETTDTLSKLGLPRSFRSLFFQEGIRYVRERLKSKKPSELLSYVLETRRKLTPSAE